PAQLGLDLGEVGVGVDAGDLVDVDGPVLDLAPAVHQVGDDVGQVELALGVVGGDGRQRLPQGSDREGVEADIAFGDGRLVAGGVAFFDAAGDLAVGIANDPSETVRSGVDSGQHRRHLLGSGGEIAIDVGGYERHIAVGDDD